MTWTRSILTLLGALALAGCPAAEDPADVPPAKPVKVERALMVEAVAAAVGPLVVVGQHSGEVRAEQVAEVSAEVAGRLVSLPHRMGDRVAAGAVVATLDDSVYQRRVAELGADLRVQRARHDEAAARAASLGLELERKRPLAATGAVTAQEVEALGGELAVAEAAAEVAEAGISASRSRLQTARDELAKTSVVAPLAGVVVGRDAEIGEHVAPGRVLARLVDGCGPVVRLAIPEQEAARVTLGSEVEVLLHGRRLAGTVKRRAPSLDERTRTLPVEVAMPGLECVEGRARVPAAAGAPALEVTPGMTATCRVGLGRVDEALAVPNQALVVAVDGGLSAWVVAEGVATQHVVEAGLRGRTETQITKGLAPGDLVIVRGHGKLVDGMEVRVMEPAR